jgi:serine/threonine-protein kinase
MEETSQFTPKIESDDNQNPQTARFVAEGSTSICYLTRYHDKLVFQKRLKKEFATDNHYIANFHKEFELGFNLDSEHIVKYLATGKDEQGIYILTEYVKGVTLTEFAKQHPGYFQSADNRKMFIDQLLSAVDCLHRHRVLHLDLKPDNIMMTEVGNQVKLIDLGYCYQDAFPVGMGGTARYSSPEQFTKKYPLSTACDIYAVGRILEELHFGPKQVIAKCLRENPKERYQSAMELRKALLQPVLRKRYLVACLVVVIVIGGLILGVLKNDRQQQPGNIGTNAPTMQESTATQQKIVLDDSTANGTANSAELENPTVSSQAPAANASPKAKEGEKWTTTATGDSVPVNDAAIKRWTKQMKEKTKQMENQAKLITDNVALYMKRLKMLYKPLSDRIDNFQKVGLQSIYGDYSNEKRWNLSDEYKTQRDKIAKSVESDPTCLSIKKRSEDINEGCQYSEHGYQSELDERFDGCIEKWAASAKPNKQ